MLQLIYLILIIKMENIFKIKKCHWIIHIGTKYKCNMLESSLQRNKIEKQHSDVLKLTTSIGVYPV